MSGAFELAERLHLQYGIQICSAGVAHNDIHDCPVQKEWVMEAHSILGFDASFVIHKKPIHFARILGRKIQCNCGSSWPCQYLER